MSTIAEIVSDFLSDYYPNNTVRVVREDNTLNVQSVAKDGSYFGFAFNQGETISDNNITGMVHISKTRTYGTKPLLQGKVFSKNNVHKALLDGVVWVKGYN